MSIGADPRQRIKPPRAWGNPTQDSTVVTVVSTTCSETLETEQRLCKDKDLCLAEEPGPRPGRQQEKAALNCSRNLPWLGDKRHSHKGTNAAGRGLSWRYTHTCLVEPRGRGRAGRESPRLPQPWRMEGPQ